MKINLLTICLLLFTSQASAESSLPPCEGKDFTMWTNCYGTYELLEEIEKGKYIKELFSGEFGNTPGSREGKGKSKVFINGKFIAEYIGEFKNDATQGTYTYADGSKEEVHEKEKKEEKVQVKDEIKTTKVDPVKMYCNYKILHPEDSHDGYEPFGWVYDGKKINVLNQKYLSGDSRFNSVGSTKVEKSRATLGIKSTKLSQKDSFRIDITHRNEIHQNVRLTTFEVDFYNKTSVLTFLGRVGIQSDGTEILIENKSYWDENGRYVGICEQREYSLEEHNRRYNEPSVFQKIDLGKDKKKLDDYHLNFKNKRTHEYEISKVMKSIHDLPNNLVKIKIIKAFENFSTDSSDPIELDFDFLEIQYHPLHKEKRLTIRTDISKPQIYVDGGTAYFGGAGRRSIYKIHEYEDNRFRVIHEIVTDARRSNIYVMEYDFKNNKGILTYLKQTHKNSSERSFEFEIVYDK